MRKGIGRLVLWLAALSSACYADGLDTIRLDLTAGLETYAMDVDGKWEGTYSGDYQSLDFETFRFSHLINAMQSVSTDANGMPYWDGFTLCTSGDKTDYGMAGSSNGWIDHQWGCMAGGGLNASGKTEKGAPYLVAYWGYNYEEADVHSLQTEFLDGETHRPLGIWVCNHPWPYYGIEHDDGFAHSFADNGAYFNLIIHGMDEEGKEAGIPITVPLASFHDNKLDIASEWRWVDLSSLGQVNGLYFTMESSDEAGALGMNTAAYFCVGGLEILEHVDEIARPTGLEAEAKDENHVELKWGKVDGAAYYRLYVDSVLVDSTEARSFVFGDLETYTSYRFGVEAVSPYGEHSDWGFAVCRTKDLTPPTPPQNVRVTETGLYKIVLTWDAGTDNVAVDKYAVYVDGKRYSRPKYTTVSLTGLDSEKSYHIELETLDTSGNASERVWIDASTQSNATGVEETSAEKGGEAYTIDGRKTSGKVIGQVYIVKTNNGIRKQIKQQ